MTGRLLFNLVFACLLVTQGGAETNRCFVIRVVDMQTGRGVPLVELKTVNQVAWWTDSAGLVAFDEPGLMGQEVYLHVNSPGYEYPKDFFDNRGVKLRPVPGGRAEVKLKRLQIAERLYRVTGAGIYRDSVLAGERVPLKQPVLNAQVFGQDTVIATPYRGQIYWFWGDTDRASYPLGNFGASGATSERPGHGGLDPGVGIDLTYFTNVAGFSKPMCPDSSFGEGLKWIEGIATLPSDDGREQMLARVAAGTGLSKTRDWHLALFNDRTETFESMVRWDIHETHDSAHPFRASVDGVEYLYFYPNWRVRAELGALKDLQRYEAFTCVAGDGRVRGKETNIERDGSGRAYYTWKAGADRLHPGRLRELIRAGNLKPGEAWLALRDIEGGAPVDAGRGSVFWNSFRGRWVAIVSGQPGEIWFSEADTPTGPWAYARQVATHGRYNFYNPTQHPFFDQDQGRLIYFEGTYTDSFSGAPSHTPRYNYNQVMYRLLLDDPRLALPAPVYRVKQSDGTTRHLMRDGVEAARAWERVETIMFFAVPPARKAGPLVPVFAGAEAARWETNAPTAGTLPLFLALPPGPLDGVNAAADSTAFELLRDGLDRPVCRVWRNPLNALPLDYRASPGP